MNKFADWQKEGVKAFRAGKFEAAKEHFEAARQVAAAEQNEAKVAEALNDLGVVLRQLGDLEGALDRLEEALTIFETLADKKGQAQSLGNLASVQEAGGEYEGAVKDYIDSAVLFEEVGETEMAMYSWQALSRLKLRQKDWLSAIAAYEEGIARLPDNSLKKKMLQKLLQSPGKFMP